MHEFALALASKELERYSAWFADDIQLFTPIHEKPIVGRQGVCQSLSVVAQDLDDIRQQN